MKEIKGFLRTLDIFGTTFSFRYKDRERYQTISGGIIIILFIILVLVVGIYYFIPFSNRKNYTIVYYTMNLASTDEVNLFRSESNFAIGLFCDNYANDGLSVYDLLNLKTRYTLFAKRPDGSKERNRKELKTHKCTYEDFYNKYNKQFDFLSLSKYECLDEKNGTIQGIYTDQIFSYYEFSVEAKNNSVLKELDRFLLENDCKLEFYYTDIIIDLNNYKKPITQYLNEIFIQLNPLLQIKRNIFFMNQHFTNDNYLLFVFGDDDLQVINPLYSRYEEYALYKGLNRISTQAFDYTFYSKVFIRADLKKTIIQRKYQKFMEFYADASSLLVALYEIIFFIYSFIDYFYAYHTLSKHLFFFKELETENNFNISQKRKQIIRIISAISNKENNIKINKENDINSSDIDENQNDIKIYKNSDVFKFKNSNKKEENSETPINNEKSRGIKNLKKFKTQTSKFKKENDKNNNINSESNRYSNRLILKKHKSQNILNIKKDISKYNDDINIDNSFRIMENSFNIFEIIITQFFRFCMCKRMKIKNIVNENANKIMYKKLDIITFIRNMLLFDIINGTILNDGKKNIINFLCRPLLSFKESQKIEIEEFYKRYKENDFDKFEKDIIELADKSHNDDKENNLIFILNEHLKDFIST